MSQWVQHISGQGEKWEVTERGDLDISWKVEKFSGLYYLPKSEYVLCDPPEQWVDVTAECDPLNGIDAGANRIVSGSMSYAVGYVVQGYRLRKVQLWDLSGQGVASDIPRQWAFIVERKEP